MTPEEWGRLEHITHLAYVGGDGDPQADVRWLAGVLKHEAEQHEKTLANYARAVELAQEWHERFDKAADLAQQFADQRDRLAAELEQRRDRQ